MSWKTSGMSLLVMLAALCAAPASALDLNGYYEGQTTGYAVGREALWLLTNRLRVDFKSDLGSRAAVAGDILVVAYHGYTHYDLLSMMPAAEAAQIRQTLGSAADSLFGYDYEATQFQLDNAYLTFYPGAALSFRFGRQQLPWGTGYAWNPTDVFNRKSLLDPTYEKPGQDAIKAEWGFGESGGLTAVWMPGADWEQSTRALRAKVQVGVFDVSASVIESVEERIDVLSASPWARETRRIYGADVVGQVGDFGVWAEGAAVQGPDGQRNWELVMGTDTTFSFQTSLMLEYYRNWGGEADSADYTTTDWIDLVLGQRTTLGRDYAMVMISHPLTDLLTGTLTVVVNANDRSAVWIPSLEYSYSDNVVLTLAGNLFSGQGDSEYGGLDANSGYLRVKAFF